MGFERWGSIMRNACILLFALCAPGSLWAEDSPAKQYKALMAQYEEEGGARLFAEKFLALAEKYPDDAIALDALLWVVKNVRGRSETSRALVMLTRNHLKNPGIGSAFPAIVSARSVAAEPLLRAIIEKSPKRSIQAQACYSLALLLEQEARIARQLKDQPELRTRILQYYGKEYGQHLSSLDPEGLTKQQERVYKRILKSFADVKVEEGDLGIIAKKALFALRHLAIGKVAPEITGKDINGQGMKLSDHRGKIVVLSFWGHW